MKKNEKMTKKEVGHKGGVARTERYNKEELSEQATKAAKTVEERHPGFHSKIGQKGGRSRAASYTLEKLSKQAKKVTQTFE